MRLSITLVSLVHKLYSIDIILLFSIIRLLLMSLTVVVGGLAHSSHNASALRFPWTTYSPIQGKLLLGTPVVSSFRTVVMLATPSACEVHLIVFLRFTMSCFLSTDDSLVC